MALAGRNGSSNSAGLESPLVEELVEEVERGAMVSLPRRKMLTASIAATTPPMMQELSFKSSRLMAIGRLFVWLRLLLHFALATALDRLRRRDTPDRRAVRLRRTLERAGGTFVKIGQQMAMRVDFLPWVYSVELSELTDTMAPFPAEEAIAIFEKASGRSIGEVFSRFDPEPVSSMAVACIYQARLKDGRQVIVKVRRPGAGERFMADLKVIHWLLLIIEFLAIFRSGATKNLRRDFRESLIGELDFVQEARQQDLFRRAAKKSGKKFFTAPRVHFDLSGDEVIVEDFVSGMWLWEFLEAIEQKDRRILELAERLNITPPKVARRLAFVNFWGWSESVFFNAGPHPDNIILGPNSKLIFTDFTVVDSVDKSKRQALQQNMHFAWKRDALNMARASLILLEPLPPLDLIEFTQELENYNYQMLYVFAAHSSGASWSERTFAIQWLGLAAVARKYGVTIETDVLRLLRAVLLFDSMALRLDSTVNLVKEYRKFTDHRATQARKRVVRSASKQMRSGSTDQFYLRLDRIVDTGEGLLFRLRHTLKIPTVNFHMLMSKWSYAVSTLIGFVAQVALVTLVGMVVAGGVAFYSGETVTELQPLLEVVSSSRVYQGIILLLVLLSGRNVLFRMDDSEI